MVQKHVHSNTQWKTKECHKRSRTVRVKKISHPTKNGWKTGATNFLQKIGYGKIARYERKKNDSHNPDI